MPTEEAHLLHIGQAVVRMMNFCTGNIYIQPCGDPILSCQDKQGKQSLSVSISVRLPARGDSGYDLETLAGVFVDVARRMGPREEG